MRFLIVLFLSMDAEELKEKLNGLALNHQNASHSESDDDEERNYVSYGYGDNDDNDWNVFSDNDNLQEPDPGHTPTTEELQPYLEELRISDGYDVSEYPDFYPESMIIPINRPWDEDREEYMTGHSKFALDEYNKREGTKYEVVRTVKANKQYLPWALIYYITFEAMDPDNPNAGIQTFQAEVFFDEDDSLQFKECRRKPSA